MDLIIGIAILLGIGLILASILIYKINKSPEGRDEALAHYKFIIKWWVIGKYHCKGNSNTKRLFNILHKLFWGINLIGISLVLAKLVEVVC